MVKTVTNKTKEFTGLVKKIKTELNEVDKLRKELQDFKDSNNIGEIGKSQKFVSEKYDELAKETVSMATKFKENMNIQKKIDNELIELKKKLDNNIKHTSSNAKYSRMDSLEVNGVPYTMNNEGKESCKHLILDICKELHLLLPENAISTAHRLRQHHTKTGPPPIIVRFTTRDYRNQVFDLRKLLREKANWKCCNITARNFYINESLTPEAKKLVYATKVFKREMARIHGKIFVWTYKGNVFLRKDVENAPRIAVESENDLNKLRKGELSLDPPKVISDTEEPEFPLRRQQSRNLNDRVDEIIC